VFTNFHQHEAYLEKRGIVKQPALGRKHGKRIA
jgi:hypothetical protein